MEGRGCLEEILFFFSSLESCEGKNSLLLPPPAILPPPRHHTAAGGALASPLPSPSPFLLFQGLRRAESCRVRRSGPGGEAGLASALPGRVPWRRDSPVSRFPAPPRATGAELAPGPVPAGSGRRLQFTQTRSCQRRVSLPGSRASGRPRSHTAAS